MAKKPKPKKSTKKPTPRRKPAPRPPAPPTENQARMPSAKELTYLANLSDQCRSKATTASGTIGQEIKTYADSRGLNPAAFRNIDKLRRMGEGDPIKLRGFLDHFDEYRKLLKIDSLKATNLVAPVSKKKSSRTSKQKASGEMKPVGEAATNVVNLAGAMAKAIEDDKASQPKGEMVG